MTGHQTISFSPFRCFHDLKFLILAATRWSSFHNCIDGWSSHLSFQAIGALIAVGVVVVVFVVVIAIFGNAFAVAVVNDPEAVVHVQVVDVSNANTVALVVNRLLLMQLCCY